MRAATERPDVLEAGTALLVGTRRAAIINAVEELWHSRDAYDRLARVANPYGDGEAAKRIRDVIRDLLAD